MGSVASLGIVAYVFLPVMRVLYAKGAFVFPIFFLISFLLGNFIGFRIVLHLLKVTENVNKRSMLLTGLFLITQAFSASITYLTGLVEPASVVISIVLFSFILKRFMVLKLWQVILIPIGVSLVSGLVLAILLMSTVQLWGGSRV